MEFRDALKALRGELGLTQAELAHVLHVNNTTVSRWELGKARPSSSVSAALLEYARANCASKVCKHNLERTIARARKKKITLLSDSLYLVEHASLSHVIHDAVCPIFICDFETNEILYANRKAQELIGGQSGDIKHMKCYACLARRTSPCENCRKSELTADAFTHYETPRLPSGVSYRVYGKIIHWNGRRAHLSYIAQTDTEKRLSAVVETIGDGVCAAMFDENGQTRLVHANDLFFRLIGYTKAQFDAEHPSLLDAAVSEAFSAARCMSLSEQTAAFRFQLFRRDGEVADVRCKATLSVVDGLDAPVLVAVFAEHSVTERADRHATPAKRRLGDAMNDMREAILRQQDMIARFEQALREGQFEAWFQPRVNHVTGVITGAEALARWRHPVWGVLSPAEFIPILERTGRICELDQFMWDQACRQLVAWKTQGLNPVPISVNVSRGSIRRTDVLELLSEKVKAYGLPPALLNIDIAETVFSDEPALTIDVVKRLAARGFIVCVDDSSCGRSLLTTLRDVPAQVLKMDTRFLEDDGDARRGGSIVESIVRMFSWLGMSVVAKGVESAELANYLKSIGCEDIQGYLYSRPVPAAAFETFLTRGTTDDAASGLRVIESWNNSAFWNPKSLESLIFNNYMGGACIFEYHGGSTELLRCNDGYMALFRANYSYEHAQTRRDILLVLDEVNRALFLQTILKAIGEHKEASCEMKLTGTDGTHMVVGVTMHQIAAANEHSLIYAVVNDITAQWKEREIAEEMRLIMANVNSGIVASTYSSGGVIRVLFANDLFYDMFGYTKQQMDSEVHGEMGAVHPDDLERVMATVDKLVREGGSVTYQYRCVKRDGAVITVSCVNSVTRFKGVDEPVLLAVISDVSERIEAELRERRARQQLQAVMDNVNVGITAIVYDGHEPRYLMINNRYYDLIGYTKEEYHALPAFSRISEDDRKRVMDVSKQVYQSGEHAMAEFRFARKDGSVIWMRDFMSMTRLAGIDQPVQLSIFSDITSERNAMQELLDNLPGGAAMYHYDGKDLTGAYINRRFWELVNRSPMDYTGQSVMMAVHPDDRAMLFEQLDAAILKGQDASFDVRTLYGTHEYRKLHATVRLVHKHSGVYALYVSFAVLSAEELTIRETLPIALQAVMNLSSDIAFVKDRDRRYICCSRKFFSLAGFEHENEIIGRDAYAVFPPELAKRYDECDTQLLHDGESLVDFDAPFPTKDGTRHLLFSKYPLLDGQGNVLGIYGIGRDVTEARDTQSRLELLTNSIPGGIASFEAPAGAIDQIKIVYFSDGLCRLHGYSREEYERIAAVNPFDFVMPDDVPVMLEHIHRLVSEGVPMDYTYRLRSRSGAVEWINIKAAMGESDGNRLTANAVFINVTEQTLAAEKLRISEEEKQLAIQHSTRMICRYDVAQKSLTILHNANPIFALETVIADVPDACVCAGLISNKTIDAYMAFYSGILNGEQRGSAVFQRLSTDGWRWLDGQFSTIYTNDGKPSTAIISFRDITERRERDAAYQRWQQTLRDKKPERYSVFRCNISKNTSFDTTGGKLLPLVYEDGAMTFDERTEEYAAEWILKEDQEAYLAFMKSDALLAGFYRGKRSDTMDFREKLPQGGYRWLRLTLEMTEYTDTQDVEAYLLFENIDEAKRAELAMIERAENDPLTGALNRVTFMERVNHLLDNAPPNTMHALLMLDVDGFKQVNDTLGHGAGDQALIDITMGLRAILRRDDLVARIGGDEFLVFMNNIRDVNAAAEKARLMCATARRTLMMDVRISGSVGIAVSPRDGSSFDVLYHKADTALYHIKSAGKNNFAFFCDHMTEERFALTEEPAVQTAAEPDKKARRMLIVDDDNITHAMFSNIFQNEFIIEKARDGNAALACLRRYGRAISVVLLDLMMPGMNGFAVLEKMRGSDEMKHIPVLVVSGDESRETCLEAIRNGASDFITKPVDVEILRVRVRSAVSKAENEWLRAENTLLAIQNNERLRFETALDSTGIAFVEYDWPHGVFTYFPSVTKYISGCYDARSLWQIFLDDHVTDVETIERMRRYVHAVAHDEHTADVVIVRLKTPTDALHRFRVCARRIMDELKQDNTLIISLDDLDFEDA